MTKTGGTIQPHTPVRVSVITNIPVPYRIPVYEQLDDREQIDLTVFYSAERERNRHWVLPPTRVRSIVLRSMVLNVGGKYIHVSRGAWRAIRDMRPDVIITTGFNPPQLVAIAYCLVHRVPHVAQTDGTVASERGLTPLHRLARRFTARHTASFVAASESGLQLLRTWGAPAGLLHRSPLAVDNPRFAETGAHPRTIDLLFAGQLSSVKNPLFALEVARSVSRRLGRRVTLTYLGEGPLRADLEDRARKAEAEVDVDIAGFQQQHELFDWYRRARVFLFPTRWDPWGLVSNEAAAAGTPQVISPSAGAAGELVRDGEAGYIEELDVERWAARAADLLTDEATWRTMSEAASAAVEEYTFSAAAEGLRAAIRQATR